MNRRRRLVAINHARSISAMLFFFVFLVAHFSISLGSAHADAVDVEKIPIKPPPAPPAELVRVEVGVGSALQPMAKGPTDYRVAVELVLAANSTTRSRRMAAFQLCLACKCCVAGAADPNTCATMPCCFGIDCQLPNKPFGVCAFVPKTCNCISCAAS